MKTIGLYNNKMEQFKNIKEKNKSNFNFKASFKTKPAKFDKKILNNSNLLFDEENPIFVNNFIEIKKNFNNIDSFLKEIDYNLKRKFQNTFKTSNHFDYNIDSNLNNCFNLIKESEYLIKQLDNFKKLDNYYNKENILIDNLKIFLNNIWKKKINLIRKKDNLLAQNIKSINNNITSEFDFLENDEDILYDEDGDQLLILKTENDNKNKDLEKIVERINILSNLMSQLSEMSYSQGEMIDRIDLNITNSLDLITKGNCELVVAKDYLENGFASKIIKLLLFLNIILFSVILIKKYI